MTTGSDYKATRRLTDRAGEVLANVGETCDRVPADSMGWLIEQRIVVPLSEESAPPPAGPTRRRADDDGGQ